MLTAIAVNPSTMVGTMRTISDAIFMSYGSSFLPRYSGVRPIISPPINAATITKTSIPFKPEPTPPRATSPNCIMNSVTRPPIGVSESCMPFAAPLDVAVVATATNAVRAMPNRTSLPSMCPPGFLIRSGRRSAHPDGAKAAFPTDSAR